MAKKVADALSIQNPHLGRLMKQVRQLQVLNTAVMKVLEPPLRDHCHVASFDGSLLVIQAESAVWATQLQFISEELRFSVQQQMPFSELIRSIKVQVRPQEPQQSQQTSTKRPVAVISGKSKTYLKDFADTIEDTGLREAFKRLAKKD